MKIATPIKLYRPKHITDFSQFNQQSNVIITNHIIDDLLDIADKIYTCDLFGND